MATHRRVSQIDTSRYLLAERDVLVLDGEALERCFVGPTVATSRRRPRRRHDGVVAGGVDAVAVGVRRRPSPETADQAPASVPRYTVPSHSAATRSADTATAETGWPAVAGRGSHQSHRREPRAELRQ